jgi:hypothetical protein
LNSFICSNKPTLIVPATNYITALQGVTAGPVVEDGKASIEAKGTAKIAYPQLNSGSNKTTFSARVRTNSTGK